MRPRQRPGSDSRAHGDIYLAGIPDARLPVPVSYVPRGGATFKRGASCIDYSAHIDEGGAVVDVWTPYSLATQGTSTRCTTVREAMHLALEDFDARIVSAIAHAATVPGATQVRRDYERTLRIIRADRDAMDGMILATGQNAGRA